MTENNVANGFAANEKDQARKLAKILKINNRRKKSISENLANKLIDELLGFEEYIRTVDIHYIPDEDLSEIYEEFLEDFEEIISSYASIYKIDISFTNKKSPFSIILDIWNRISDYIYADGDRDLYNRLSDLLLPDALQLTPDEKLAILRKELDSDILRGRLENLGIQNVDENPFYLEERLMLLQNPTKEAEEIYQITEYLAVQEKKIAKEIAKEIANIIRDLGADSQERLNALKRGEIHNDPSPCTTKDNLLLQRFPEVPRPQVTVCTIISPLDNAIEYTFTGAVSAN